MRHVLILILACLPLLIAAVEPAQIRAIADKTGPAVVTIRIVSTMKIAIMGQNRTLDHESEAVGVIVDPSGLTVTSVMDLDPSAMMKAVLGGNPMIKFDSTIKEIALRLADGSEIAAELALKDDDLGLAILRPTKPGQAFAALAPKAGAALQLGDRALVIGRAARHAASALMVVEFQVQGTVGGPQPYALVPAMSGAVCDGEGHLIGIATMKPAPAPPAQAGAEMDPLMGITAGLDAKNRTPLPIVRPIDTVMKLVTQAKAKPATP